MRCEETMLPLDEPTPSPLEHAACLRPPLTRRIYQCADAQRAQVNMRPV